MKFIFLVLFALVMLSCNKVQTQQVTNSNSININSNNKGEEIGYSRFTKTDKQYLGCWKSIEASEIVDYELKFFRFDKKNIQTSKMSKSINYSEIDSNKYKDYFVLQIDSKYDEIQPYLSINILNADEITFHEFKNKNDIIDGEGINYWNLKREDCKKIKSKFK